MGTKLASLDIFTETFLELGSVKLIVDESEGIFNPYLFNYFFSLLIIINFKISKEKFSKYFTFFNFEKNYGKSINEKSVSHKFCFQKFLHIKIMQKSKEEHLL